MVVSLDWLFCVYDVEWNAVNATLYCSFNILRSFGMAEGDVVSHKEAFFNGFIPYSLQEPHFGCNFVATQRDKEKSTALIRRQVYSGTINCSKHFYLCYQMSKFRCF